MSLITGRTPRRVLSLSKGHVLSLSKGHVLSLSKGTDG